MKNVNIDIAIKSKKWQKRAKIKQFIIKTTKKLLNLTEISDFLAKKDNYLELSILLVSDIQIKKINQQFRHKNKATDVLSFPFLDEKQIAKNGLKKTLKNLNQLFLGDIILSIDTILKEALKSDKKFHDHLTHLLLHSILHLLGYDHEKNKIEEKKMEDLEIKILHKLKISNPYK